MDLVRILPSALSEVDISDRNRMDDSLITFSYLARGMRELYPNFPFFGAVRLSIHGTGRNRTTCPAKSELSLHEQRRIESSERNGACEQDGWIGRLWKVFLGQCEFFLPNLVPIRFIR